METIGSRIALYRNSRRWTQGRLASETSMQQSVLSNIENDKVSPRWDTLVEIAKKLEISLLRLLPLENHLHTNDADCGLKEEDRLWEILLKAKDDLLRAKEEMICVLKRQIELFEREI